MAFIWPSRVRFADTDASGRIHYTAMLRHFEAAEIEYFRSADISYDDGPKRGYSFPRVHVECTYTGPVRSDDVLDIAVSVAKLGNTSFTLAFDAMVEAHTAARGSITIVCMDIKTQKSRALPDDFREKLKARGNLS